MKRIVFSLLVILGCFNAACAASWGGTYDIYSDGYRMCPPPMSVFLTLSANGSNRYTGSWAMKIADDDAIGSGMLFADAIGTVSNGVMTITLTNVSYTRGKDGCYFTRGGESTPRIANGTVVAKITKNGSRYKIQPVGKMKKYLTDLGGMLTVVKTK